MLFIEPEAKDLQEALNAVRRPLNPLGEAELCPGWAALEECKGVIALAMRIPG